MQAVAARIVQKRQFFASTPREPIHEFKNEETTGFSLFNSLCRRLGFEEGPSLPWGAAGALGVPLDGANTLFGGFRQP